MGKCKPLAEQVQPQGARSRLFGAFIVHVSQSANNFSELTGSELPVEQCYETLRVACQAHCVHMMFQGVHIWRLKR